MVRQGGSTLEKAIAATGRWSRSQSASLISQNRVTLNDAPCRRPSLRVDRGTDVVAIDGERVHLREAAARLWRFHKPTGLITTRSDPQGRPTIHSALPPGLPRMMTVGRLDIATEGLLLLTTSGPLARLLELPSTGVERRYCAQIATGTERGITADMIGALGCGLTLSDGTRFRPIRAETLAPKDGGGRGHAWVRMTLVEGKKHEVRRAWAHFGFTVTRLVRESFGPFELGRLQPGQVEEVQPVEVERLTRRLKNDGGQPGGSTDGQGKAPPRRSRDLRHEFKG